MVTILVFSILFGLSCSNDSDLLADIVLTDEAANNGIVSNDYFVVQQDKTIILDVLSNDNFSWDDNVRITEISSPAYGSVEINEDSKSIIYTSQSSSGETQTGEETTDTFTYTTEIINEDETTSTDVGIVEIVIDSSTNDDEVTEEQENSGSESVESHSANLLFSSGFEGVTLSSPNNGYRYIQGNDSNTGFSWPPKILGSTGTEQEPSGIHIINDGGQSIISNKLESVVGPNGTQTTALHQGIDGTVGVTQTPYQINNISENPDELYITYWMKIDNTSLIGSYKWRALWEYKTDNYDLGTGFRMIAFIYTDNNGRAYWNFQGDRNPSNPVWEKSNFDIPVPRDEWFKVEYYFKWDEGSDGKAFMKVNGQLVGEHYGATTADSKDLSFIILTQVYGDTSPMHQWVDDIEIWDGIPN